MYIIYGTATCSYCRLAKDLVESKGMDWLYYDLVTVEPDEQERLQKIAGKRFKTVPQVFFENADGMQYVGDYTTLKKVLED